MRRGPSAPLPYTAMCLRVMQAGFTADEALSMSVTEAMNWIDAWDWLRTPADPDAPRQATQADIDAFFG